MPVRVLVLLSNIARVATDEVSILTRRILSRLRSDGIDAEVSMYVAQNHEYRPIPSDAAPDVERLLSNRIRLALVYRYNLNARAGVAELRYIGEPINVPVMIISGIESFVDVAWSVTRSVVLTSNNRMFRAAARVVDDGTHVSSHVVHRNPVAAAILLLYIAGVDPAVMPLGWGSALKMLIDLFSINREITLDVSKLTELAGHLEVRFTHAVLEKIAELA